MHAARFTHAQPCLMHPCPCFLPMLMATGCWLLPGFSSMALALQASGQRASRTSANKLQEKRISYLLAVRSQLKNSSSALEGDQDIRSMWWLCAAVASAPCSLNRIPTKSKPQRSRKGQTCKHIFKLILHCRFI